MNLSERYALSRKARLHWDERRGAHVLLYPERGLLLNPTAARVLRACDGRTSAQAIADGLAAEFGVARETVERDVRALLDALLARGLLTRVP